MTSGGIQFQVVRKSLILGILALFLSSQTFAANLLPYINPGVRVGYVFGKGFSTSMKIGFGVALITDHIKSSKYLNVTFGIKQYLLKRGTTNYREAYTFREIHVGMAPLRSMILGASYGSIKPKGADRSMAKRHWSVYGGMGGFISFESDQLGSGKPNNDLGFTAILPVSSALMAFNGGM